MKQQKIKIDDDKRYERQSDIFCGAGLKVGIVGVGAVGRQIALQLSAMGVSQLVICDPDKVEDVNLCAQGYRERDLGKYKVEATAKACWELNNTVKITRYADIYTHQRMVEPEPCRYVFMCVDNMETRKMMAEELNMTLFDSRMGARVAVIKSITDDVSYEYYMKELFDDDQMVKESCTSKSTIFCANICAGLMVNQLVKHHRDQPINHDFFLDLNTMAYCVRHGGDDGTYNISANQRMANEFTFYEDFKAGNTENKPVVHKITDDEIDMQKVTNTVHDFYDGKRDHWAEALKLKAYKEAIANGTGEDKGRRCQCCTCEQVFHTMTGDCDCPHCGSGNWVYGMIDNPEPDDLHKAIADGTGELVPLGLEPDIDEFNRRADEYLTEQAIKNNKAERLTLE